MFFSVLDPDPVSFFPWIRDSPHPDNNPDHISWSLETNFSGLKYFNSLMRIRDPGLKNPDPGWKKVDPGYTSRIRNTGFFPVACFEVPIFSK
jgi:hypothetical protein